VEKLLRVWSENEEVERENWEFKQKQRIGNLRERGIWS
jgi:hypothetical protein